MSPSHPPSPSNPLAAACAMLAMLLFAATQGFGADDTQPPAGADIYKYCVSCHGKRGEGGEQGKYPRIAGLPQPYVDKQLHAFKNQTRVNKPMVPIFKHHRFDAEIIALVAGHVSELNPPQLQLWPYEPNPEVLTTFADKAAYQAAGADTYAQSCAECHGDDGAGIDAATGGPPLTGQYPAYLIKQIGDFGRGEREQAASARCGDLTPELADAVIAHLVELGK